MDLSITVDGSEITALTIANLLASEKWCTSVLTTVPKAAGYNQRGITILSNDPNSASQTNHFPSVVGFKGSTQSLRSLQISCSICFPQKMYGDKKPKGSNTLGTVDKKNFDGRVFRFGFTEN